MRTPSTPTSYGTRRTRPAAAPYDSLTREAAALSRDYKVHISDASSYGPLPAQVARLTFRTPDGRVSEAKISGGYHVWYTNLGYVDLKGKPVWATFYDAGGRALQRRPVRPGGDTPVRPRCGLATPR